MIVWQTNNTADTTPKKVDAVLHHQDTGHLSSSGSVADGIYRLLGLRAFSRRIRDRRRFIP
jgi:hypothetical protein